MRPGNKISVSGQLLLLSRTEKMRTKQLELAGRGFQKQIHSMKESKQFLQ